MRTILEINLSKARYACLSFTDGVSALHWLRQEALCTAPAVAEHWPSWDGWLPPGRARDLLNACWNEMILVMLTGRDRVTDRLKERLVGAQVYLTKPFQFEPFLAVMQATLHASPAAAW